MTREIETWPSDSRVCNNSVVDHRSQSSLHCVTVSTDVAHSSSDNLDNHHISAAVYWSRIND